ncbi:unnamed protein product [Allacma fusca]|uniref:Uncharacterized protein n=1 Tax=Allacma fusca TaxID=39272 RepID=A0A8J2L054_9HEXA|nr:unnamed protein product [Allacma fusca]
MSTEDLTNLAKALDKFDITKFVREHYKYVYEKTANSKIFGRELLRRKILFMEDQLEACLHNPGAYSQNEALYKHVLQMNDCLGYLQALEESGNANMIKFIREKVPAFIPPPQVSSTGPVQSSSLHTGYSYPSAPANPNEPAPQTDLGKDVSPRLQAYLRFLKEKDLDPPFFHFIRPHLTEIYEKTTDYDRLIMLLTQYGVFTQYASARMNSIPAWNTLERGTAVYDGVKVQGVYVIPKLVKALEMSGNTHIIELFDEWLKEFKA